MESPEISANAASHGCLSDAELALYYSGVAYTTLGYGDLVLPRK